MLKWLEKNLPKIVMAPAVGLIGWFVYGFVLWTLYISFTNSVFLSLFKISSELLDRPIAIPFKLETIDSYFKIISCRWI